MLSVLIIVGLLILGIILLNRSNHYSDWGDIVGSALVVGMSIVLVLCIVCIFVTQVNKDVEYQNKLHEKEMLEYRIANMKEDIVGNEMLYNDIVAFNNDLRTIKKWANNPFTNWFYVQEIATIDYVELDGN